MPNSQDALCPFAFGGYNIQDEPHQDEYTGSKSKSKKFEIKLELEVKTIGFNPQELDSDNAS